MMRRISRALISVSDKTGVDEFARGLAALGVEIISTGGTARLLREAGCRVRDVSELTGFPEMLDGRAKTLHPKVHAGILARRGKAEHQRQVAEHGIELIDLVVVNLYPFEKTAAKEGVSLEELIENIDIGGPSMIRSAAKNFEDVTVVVDAADYGPVIEEIKKNGGCVSRETRAALARKAFATTAAYDGAISTTLQKLAGETLPRNLHLNLRKAMDLRYGENPHQQAALYLDPEAVAAPGFEPAALERLAAKKNLRLIDMSTTAGDERGLELKRIGGGLLVQTPDTLRAAPEEWKCVTERQPTETERQSLVFAWRVVKHVRSNAIVYARDSVAMGVGAGQMSRVDSVKLGAAKARELGHSIEGSVVSSDAFFPFPEGVEEAAKA